MFRISDEGREEEDGSKKTLNISRMLHHNIPHTIFQKIFIRRIGGEKFEFCSTIGGFCPSLINFMKEISNSCGVWIRVQHYFNAGCRFEKCHFVGRGFIIIDSLIRIIGCKSINK